MEWILQYTEQNSEKKKTTKLHQYHKLSELNLSLYYKCNLDEDVLGIFFSFHLNVPGGFKVVF